MTDSTTPSTEPALFAAHPAIPSDVEVHRAVTRMLEALGYYRSAEALGIPADQLAAYRTVFAQVVADQLPGRIVDAVRRGAE